MSKTLEIWHRHKVNEGNVKVVSPDHDEHFNGDSYTLDANVEQLFEDGVTRVDISPDRYFHVTKDYKDHLHISIDNAPQTNEERTILFPYSDNYTFSEKCSELDIAATKNAMDAFKYMPHLRLEMTWQPDSSEATASGVEINGTVYDLEER